MQQIPMAMYEVAEERHRRTVVWLIIGWAASVIALIVSRKAK